MPIETNSSAASPQTTEYESYSVTCKVYDRRRKAIGINYISDAISQVMQRTGRTKEGLRLLDAGCGTGNYITQVANMVGQAVGLDYNEGMLEQCRSKCKGLTNVTLQQGDLLALPFEDNSFDIVIINQVLHHIAGSHKEDNVRILLKHFQRILRKGGAVIINTQDPKQHINGFWWAEIIPDAVQRLADRLVTVKWMHQAMKDLGFEIQLSESPSEPLMALEMYRDTQGPFKEGFRSGDSTWSLATEQELADGLKWYRSTVIEKDLAAEYMRKREALRAKCGQTTSVVAMLPL